MFDCRQIYASNHRRRLDTPGIPGGEGAPQMVNPGMAPIGQCLGLDMLQHGWETFCVHAQFFIPVVKNFFFLYWLVRWGFDPIVCVSSADPTLTGPQCIAFYCLVSGSPAAFFHMCVNSW